MKKISKIGLLTALTLFAGINNVNAINCDDWTGTASQYFDQESNIEMHGDWSRTIHKDTSGGNYLYDKYTLNGPNGETFASYCRNAGWQTGAKTSTKFYCERSLYASDDSDSRKAFDYGIAQILQNGYSTVGSGFSLSEEEEYIATSIALRVYESLFPEFADTRSDSVYDNELLAAHRYYTNKFLQDSDIYSKAKAASGSTPPSYSKILEIEKLTANGVDITSQVEQEAKKLLKAALDKAVEYNDGKVPTISHGKAIKLSDGAKKKNVTYSFDIQNFHVEDGAYVTLSFECADCDKYGVKTTITANGTEIGKGSYDVLKAFGNTKVEYKIAFDGTSDKYNCEELEYKVTLSYYDASISTEAIEVKSEGCRNATNCQSFYILDSLDNENLEEIEDTVELCGNSCEELEIKCDNGNGDPKACEKLDTDCSACTTYVSDARCSLTDTKLDIVEGSEGQNTCTPADENKINIFKCIIQKDATQAGNKPNKKDLTGEQTYEASKLLTTSYNDNPFCSVACKENFHLTLPGSKETITGRYFVLQGSIRGDKRCYTSVIKKGDIGVIDEETFEGLYEKQRQELIKTWNLIKFKEALAGASGSSINATASHNNHTSGTYYDLVDVKVNGKVVRQERVYKIYTSRDTRTYVKERVYKLNFKAYDYKNDSYDIIRTLTDYSDLRNAIGLSVSAKDKAGDHPSSVSYELTCAPKDNNGSVECTLKTSGKFVNCGDDDGNFTGHHAIAYDAPSNEDILKEHPITNSTMANLQKMQDILDTMERQIKECTTWANNVKGLFEPVVKFEYAEKYMNDIMNYGIDTFVLNGGGSSTSTSTCNRNKQGEPDNYYEKCTGGIEYETASTTPHGYSYRKVTLVGEGINYKNISDMPLSLGVTTKTTYNQMDFITPTQFFTLHSTGEMVINPNAAVGSIENSDVLVNGLPVGLGTKSGTYNYRIKVSNLGEYFQTQTKGRVWNSEGHNKTIVEVASKDVCHNSSVDRDGYTCSYRVNCPDCPVEQVCPKPCCVEPCPVECEDTIYCDRSNISYRPITPENTNPNNRDLGKNWNWGNVETDFELKAYAATREIQEDGELIYDVSQNGNSLTNNNQLNNNFAFKYTMTVEDQKLISARNKEIGTYADNSLKCYDYTGKDGVVYSNIYCYSNFIDWMIRHKTIGKHVAISGNRIIGSTDEISDSLRRTKTQSSGYWKTWDEVNATKWDLITESKLQATQGNYKDGKDKKSGTGPSYT